MAFDTNGKIDCSGTPTVCNPLWTGVASGVLTGSPAIANGKVYVTDSSFALGLETHLYAWVLPPPTTAVMLPSNGAKATIYGWTASWNTTTAQNGTYTLQSVASYGGEVSGTSPGITITVSN